MNELLMKFMIIYCYYTVTNRAGKVLQKLWKDSKIWYSVEVAKRRETKFQQKGKQGGIFLKIGNLKKIQKSFNPKEFD